ncbi:flagellar assembly peptidoglycan hydrolase FlgJ [Gynuella sp.]|uniref:flagellar assembly peptidoglycan hydrolase FlgJ n=1 Tax=Gynuella sp. TaxID=2969146 RepID=UPI003D095F2D
MNTLDLTHNATIYNDLNGLNSIKMQARSDQDGAVMQVAKQFESMFIGMMLKSMRDANEVLFEDSEFNSYEGKFYRQMYDEQLSQELSSGSGIGLADMIFEQLQQQYSGNRIPAAQLSTNITPVEVPESAHEAQTDMTDTTAPQVHTDSIDPVSFADPASFVETLLPIAEKVGRQMGIEPKALVAQAALETGWGQHVMKDVQGGSSYNLFGIKAHGGWQGDVAVHKTLEHDGNQFYSVTDQFRSYKSYQDCFQDYLDFLQSNPRYQAVLASGKDSEAFAESLQSAGYATDPQYAQKIKHVLNSEWLMNS